MVECQAVGCAFIVTMCRADGVLEEWVCAFFLRVLLYGMLNYELCPQVYDRNRNRIVIFAVAADGKDMLRCRVTRTDCAPSDGVTIEVSSSVFTT